MPSFDNDQGGMRAAATPLAPSFAPWAGIVPDPPWPMTVDGLMEWPDDDGYRYELVEGALSRRRDAGGQLLSRGDVG